MHRDMLETAFQNPSAVDLRAAPDLSSLHLALYPAFPLRQFVVFLFLLHPVLWSLEAKLHYVSLSGPIGSCGNLLVFVEDKLGSQVFPPRGYSTYTKEMDRS